MSRHRRLGLLQVAVGVLLASMAVYALLTIPAYATAAQTQPTVPRDCRHGRHVGDPHCRPHPTPSPTCPTSGSTTPTPTASGTPSVTPSVTPTVTHDATPTAPGHPPRPSRTHRPASPPQFSVAPTPRPTAPPTQPSSTTASTPVQTPRLAATGANPTALLALAVLLLIAGIALLVHAAGRRR